MAYLNPSAGALREAQQQTAVADVAGTVPAGGTGATGGAWDTSGHRDTAITTVSEIKTQVNSALAKLRLAGVIAAA